MKPCALALLVLLSSACASTPTPPAALAAFRDMAAAEALMPAPLDYPERPRADVGAGPSLCFNPDAAAALLARDELLVANSRIAQECVAGFAALTAADRLLLDQARALERAYNEQAERLRYADQTLREERRDHFLERWAQRLLIVLLAGSAL